MDKIKNGSLMIVLGLAVTLVLSLFLIFAQNKDLPLLKSTGIGLLGGGREIVNENKSSGITYEGREDYFNNVYGFTRRDAAGFIVPDNSAVALGIAVKVIYWAFCLSCIAVICSILASAFSKKGLTKTALNYAIAEVFFGIAVVVIAIISVAFPASIYKYTYITQYYFLLIPLVLTLIATLLLRNKLNPSY